MGRSKIYTAFASIIVLILIWVIFSGPGIVNLVIEVQGQGYVEPGSGSFELERGQSISLVAAPQPGWVFSHWAGDIEVPPECDTTISLKEDTAVTAVFTRKEYIISLNVEGRGQVRPDPQGPTYFYGDELKLDAVSSPGWKFVGWQGDWEGTDNIAFLTVMEPMEITAVFTQEEYSLEVNRAGKGRVEVYPKRDIYFYGMEVTLTAYADPGWRFSSWDGNIEGGSAPLISFVVEGDRSLQAIFEPEEYVVGIRKEGKGTVKASPAQPFYYYGDALEVEALAEPGWWFDGWTGDLVGADNPAQITVDRDISIQAIFQAYSVLREGDTGEDVFKLQERLYTLGFLPAVPEGVFGLQTLLAVKKAQQYFALEADGVVGPATWGALDTVVTDNNAWYTVQAGDSLWRLAQRWNTSIQRIIELNNFSNPDVLRIGDRIRVPGRADMREVEDLHWSVVDRIFLRGDTAILTDVETGLSFRVYRLGGTNHADVEPLMIPDTQVLREIYGGSWSWERRAVIVHLGSRLVAGSINGYPHGEQSIFDNGFGGHICLHFRGSRLHLNNSEDQAHQERVEEATENVYPFLGNDL